MKSKLLTICAVMAFVIAVKGTAMADTINVPGDYSTIQLAIDNANPNDTIQVAAGTNVENNIVLNLRL